MTERDRALIADAARRLKPLVDRARSAALTTHITPDGDGIGAEICLARYLKARGIEARIINTDPLAAKYRFLDPDGTVEVFDAAKHDAFLRGADLIVMLDNSAVSRLGPLEPAVRASSATTVCIDHHNVVEPFWKVNVIDSDACATGELVFQIIKMLGGEVDPIGAQAAYTSLVTDTGYFRFSKTSPRCHEAAAEMLAAGVSPPAVYAEVYERNTPALLRLAGVALADLRQEEGGRMAWITLTREQVAHCQAQLEDTSDIVNDLLTIDGTRLAVLFKEIDGGRVKLSFRSKGPLDVNRLASRFGGGGHTNASGAIVPGTLEETIHLILPACRDLLQQPA
ncbi:MAG TPA: bifunctional oligoribonuclease/PAP phosphatase NrnA [Candidatus Polarisedimenticolia bacterium]|jgi:phosphoesterase RecJ-like protein|nr:bifunctional oligoribonuclease/PAP phosphatase NrnA [Candidatus Polarisedimenticolia bacterium]